MYARVFVPGEANVADCARLLRLDQCRVGTFRIEDTVWVFKAQNLMVLHQVDVIRIEPLQGFIQLPYCSLFRTPVNFRHQEHPLAIAITQCLAHANLADTIVVVPRIVHEVDAAINRRANNASAQLLIHMGQTEMPSPNTDCRHLLSRCTKYPILQTL